jgi:hypothetical protein
VWCEALHYIVHRDVRWPTYQNTLFTLKQLEDKLDQSVSFAGLNTFQ